LGQVIIHDSEDVRTGALEATLAVMRPSGILNWRYEMSSAPNVVEKHIRLSVERADRLGRLAQIHQIHEDQIIEKALDILFSLTDLLDERTERQGWSFLSEAALQRVWDNEEDAVYDNWRELYGVPAQ
jgi:hypothetical protein